MTAPHAFSAASSALDVPTVVSDLLAALPAGEAPVLCLLACTVDVDTTALVSQLRARLPRTVFVGTTSCQQVASDHGAHAKAAALFLAGDGFSAGSASGRGQQHAALGEQLTKTATTRARLAGPDAVRLVVVHATAMTDGVRSVLKDVPFLMPFTYGEQGRLRRQRIDHGNLMLSALLLTNTPQRR